MPLVPGWGAGSHKRPLVDDVGQSILALPMSISDSSSDEESSPADPLGPGLSEANHLPPPTVPVAADCPMPIKEECNPTDPPGPAESEPDPPMPEYSPCGTDYPTSPEDTTSSPPSI